MGTPVIPQIMTCHQIQDCAVGFARIASACQHQALTSARSQRWLQEAHRYQALAELLRTAALTKVVKGSQDPVLEINLMAIQISGLVRRADELQRVSPGLIAFSQLAMDLLSGGYELIPLGHHLAQIQTHLELSLPPLGQPQFLSGIPRVSLASPSGPDSLLEARILTERRHSWHRWHP